MKRLVLLLMLAASGCGTTRMHHVITGRPGAAWNGNPMIFMENQPAPADFDEVAIIQAVGRGTHADMPHVVGGLQDEAAMLGCNAVVRVHIDQGDTIATATGVAGRTRESGPAPRALPRAGNE